MCGSDLKPKRATERANCEVTNDELRDVSVEEIENVLNDFRGEIEQTPPMYSAKKVEGKKLYELARKGIEIERKPVKITIYELELIESGQPQESSRRSAIVGGQLKQEDDERQTKDEGQRTKDVSLRVVCSAGTYVRTLAEDIGRKLETGAHLAELRRTAAGKFDLSQAVTLEKLEEIAVAGRARPNFDFDERGAFASAGNQARGRRKRQNSKRHEIKI